jgi:hypothetical protein
VLAKVGVTVAMSDVFGVVGVGLRGLDDVWLSTSVCHHRQRTVPRTEPNPAEHAPVSANFRLL